MENTIDLNNYISNAFEVFLLNLKNQLKENYNLSYSRDEVLELYAVPTFEFSIIRQLEHKIKVISDANKELIKEIELLQEELNKCQKI